MPNSNHGEHAPLTPPQQAAIEQIEALGGHVFLGTNQQVVETISLRGPQFMDKHLALLEPFEGYDLHSLGLVGTRFTEDAVCRVISFFPKIRGFAATNMQIGDGILAELGKNPGLLRVSLDDTRVTSLGTQHLKHLKNLTKLGLSGTAIDDVALTHLEGLDNVAWLSLGKTAITSTGLESISKLKNLEILLLNDTEVADKGLQWISPLKKLDTLRLERTRITDAGLVHLSGLSKLKHLRLDETAITDEGLKHIQHLPKLDDISMRGTKVTRKGGDRFVLYLPANKERFRKQRERFERGEWPLD